jgi:hypothetical protein
MAQGPNPIVLEIRTVVHRPCRGELWCDICQVQVLREDCDPPGTVCLSE